MNNLSFILDLPVQISGKRIKCVFPIDLRAHRFCTSRLCHLVLKQSSPCQRSLSALRL